MPTCRRSCALAFVRLLTVRQGCLHAPKRPNLGHFRVLLPSLDVLMRCTLGNAPLCQRRCPCTMRQLLSDPEQRVTCLPQCGHLPLHRHSIGRKRTGLSLPGPCPWPPQQSVLGYRPLELCSAESNEREPVKPACYNDLAILSSLCAFVSFSVPGHGGTRQRASRQYGVPRTGVLRYKQGAVDNADKYETKSPACLKLNVDVS